jgi:hypothetical protein
VLIFKVYVSGVKWKSVKLNNNSINLPLAYKKIKDKDFIFVDAARCTDLTDKFIIGMIKDREMKQTGDINLLNRIIRNNGFINYIKQLENL